MKREQAIRFLKAQPELQGATIFNLEEGKCLSFIAVIKDVFYGQHGMRLTAWNW
jgi:hypothetical protein